MYCENTVHAALDAAGTNVLAVHILVGYDGMSMVLTSYTGLNFLFPIHS